MITQIITPPMEVLAVHLITTPLTTPTSGQQPGEMSAAQAGSELDREDNIFGYWTYHIRNKSL